MTTQTLKLYSLEAEQATLGIILKNNSVFDETIRRLKTPNAFYETRHRLIFGAMERLSSSNTAIEPVSVHNELGANASEAGKLSGLVELLEATASDSNISFYLDVICDYKLKRDVLLACENIQMGCANGNSGLEIRELLEKELAPLMEISSGNTYTHIATDLVNVMEEIDRKEVRGVKSGYEVIDAFTDRFHNGDLIILAGRPSMGKTALALNMAQKIAFEQKLAVGIISLEMSRTALVKRLLSSHARIPFGAMRSDQMTQSEHERLTKSSNAFYSVPIYIEDNPTASIIDIRSMGRQLKHKNDIAILFIDYLQLIGFGNKRWSLREITTEVSRLLKSLARELDIPVVALSQLSRKVEDRTDRWPQLSDLRESGAIEQDADTVMFCYRADYYTSKERSDPSHKNHAKAVAMYERGDGKIIIAKQRNGPTGDTDLYFHREFSCWSDKPRNAMELIPQP